MFWLFQPPQPRPEPKIRGQWWLSSASHVLTPACISFVLGAVIADRMPDLFLIQSWAVPWLLVFFTGFLMVAKQRWVVQTTFWLMFLMIGGCYFNVTALSRHLDNPNDIKNHAFGQEQWIQAEIGPHAPTESRVFAKVVGSYPFEEDQLAGKILIRASKSQGDLPVGQVMWVYGTLSQPRQALFPGAFDEERYLLSHHATAVLHDVQMAVPSMLKTGEPYPPSLMARLNIGLELLRRRIAGAFQAAMPSPLSEVLGGVVLGDHAIPVDKLTRQAFIDTGLIHVLAASGMNVAIIAGFLAVIGRLCRLPFRLQLMLSIVGVVFYALLTGLPPSIQRAATMLVFALFLKLRHRELTPITLLSLAMVILVIIDPMVVTSLGFRYSVLSTFGLITMMPPIQKFFETRVSKFTLWILDALLVPVIAQLWILPLMIYHFNQFPIHSVLMNVVAVPLVAVLTCIGFTAGALSLLLPVLGQWTATLALPFMQGLMLWIDWGHQWENALVTMASPSAVLMLWFYALLVFLAVLLHPVGRAWFLRPSQTLSVAQKVSIACVLVLLTLLPLAYERWHLQGQTALDIVPLSGKQVAFVANTDSGQLFMAAPDMLNYWEARTLKDYMRHRNIQKLESLMLWPVDNPTGQKTGLTVFDDVEIQQVSQGNAHIALGNIDVIRQSAQAIQLRVGKAFCVDIHHYGHCPLSYIQMDQSATYRLLSDLPVLSKLRTRQFYHLEILKNRLSIF